MHDAWAYLRVLAIMNVGLPDDVLELGQFVNVFVTEAMSRLDRNELHSTHLLRLQSSLEQLQEYAPYKTSRAAKVIQTHTCFPKL